MLSDQFCPFRRIKTGLFQTLKGSSFSLGLEIVIAQNPCQIPVFPGTKRGVVRC